MMVSFTLNGSNPLLMHQDDVEASDRLAEWRLDPKNADLSKRGDDRTPPWTWHSCLYVGNGKVVIPSANLMVCLRNAGATKQIPGRGKKTYKEATQSKLQIFDEYLSFKCGLAAKEVKHVNEADIVKIEKLPFSKQAEEVRKLGFWLYVKRAKIGKAKHVRVRPRFDHWKVEGTIKIADTELISFELLKDLFDIAGTIGLCDWRPGGPTPGAFGMFTSELKRV